MTALFIAMGYLATKYPGLPPGGSLLRYYVLAWARNALLWLSVAGTLHLWLNVLKRQGTEAKYITRWDTVSNKKYTLGRQYLDNTFWGILSGVSVWTLYELSIVAVHRGRASVFDGSALSGIYYLSIFPIYTVWGLTHFYFAHRMLHHPVLYKHFHSVHHRNTNFGPLSGLSMHWGEHLIYFSATSFFWIVPSDPLHYQYVLVGLGVGPAFSHSGFDWWRIGKKRAAFGDYEHFLHHRLFNVNFGASSLLPLDRLLGTHHDGSSEADRRMRERMKNRRPAIQPSKKA